MVDSEHLVGGEELADDVVQFAGRTQVVAEGFLDHDPVPGARVITGDGVPFELGDHLLEVRRRNRQVEGVIAACAAGLVEFFKSGAEPVEGLIGVERARYEPDAFQ